MVLPWKNYLETNEVSFQLDENIKYVAYPNGQDGILKIESGKDDILFVNYANWEDEKQWISDNYSDIYGVYEPCKHEDLDEDDDKVCYFGKTENGLYLDRIQRREEWMDHTLTHPIIHIEGWGILHTPDGGKSIWKTEWCESRNEYYNTMRCDVFPENPGWKKMDKAEVLIELDSILSDTIKQNIIDSNFPLPQVNGVEAQLNMESPIGSVIIP